jgi:hypothetical protein
MLSTANISRQSKPLLRFDSATHLFSLGQAVRLKGGVWPSGNVYLITARLPPSGGSPQYRIRNDDEKFERMAMQANLELVSPPTSASAILTAIERSSELDK